MVVELEWFDGQGEKVPLPSKRQRRVGNFPNEPVRYRLTRLDAEDDLVFPYVLDSKVFSEHLGFTEEDIEAYVQSLRDTTEFSPIEMFTSLMERLGAETQISKKVLRLGRDVQRFCDRDTKTFVGGLSICSSV